MNGMKKNIKNLQLASKRSEKNIELYLKNQVEKTGGLCIKLNSMTETGYPDRLVLFPAGLICFAELKSKGEKPTKLQSIRHDKLRELGYPVYVLDSKEKVDGMFKELEGFYDGV